MRGILLDRMFTREVHDNRRPRSVSVKKAVVICFTSMAVSMAAGGFGVHIYHSTTPPLHHSTTPKNRCPFPSKRTTIRKELDISALSVLRMDGDMYESTLDILFNAFDKVSTNGVIIVDNWACCQNKDAVEDFFKWHNVTMPHIANVDGKAVYFVKGAEWNGVKIRRKKYAKIGGIKEMKDEVTLIDSD